MSVFHDHALMLHYENKINKRVWKYVNLLHYNRWKPTTRTMRPANTTPPRYLEGDTTHTQHMNTYLLTPWSKVLLEKLTDFQLVKKFSTFYGTRRFINAFMLATCPYPQPARSSPCQHIPLPKDPS